MKPPMALLTVFACLALAQVPFSAHPKVDPQGHRWNIDAKRQATVPNLLDAARIEDGPVAQAVLPYALPQGFHANFTPP
ncbi:MAG: hypothetical protein ACK57B_05860 [Betaproteobacteria bacterium]